MTECSLIQLELEAVFTADDGTVTRVEKEGDPCTGFALYKRFSDSIDSDILDKADWVKDYELGTDLNTVLDDATWVAREHETALVVGGSVFAHKPCLTKA